MAKKINSRDLFEQEDLFRGVRDSADKTIQKLTQLKEGMVASAKEMKAAFSGLKMDNLKDLEKFVKLAEQANKLSKQSIEVDKQKKVSTDQKKKSELELLKIEQEKEKLKQQQMRTNKMVTTEQERQNKQAEKQKKLAQDQANAYKKLEKNTRDLKNESKRLGAEMLALEQSGRKNSAEYSKLALQYKTVTSAAQKGDQQLKKLDKTVGDNFRNVGNYKSALSGLATALGGLGIAFGVGSIFKSTFGIIANFDQAQADLAAISGKTKDELAGLTAQAKELGATTQFSATQITEMQTELAKLGFETQQIQDSTKAVSNFAAATGADIPRAAALAGSALRAFNLPATEMERVVSVLGVSTTKSALDFSKLEASLSTIAPVAASFGFSIEDTTALLGTLSNAGFDASSAATATRNILLNLADSGGDLAKKLGRPITSANDLARGLKELEASGVDLAEALELTDKRSVAAFSTFMKNSDQIVKLKAGITDVNQELEDMAAKRLDSINGQLTLLSSAWEGFILGTNDATGASESIKNAIGFLAENLSTIMNVIVKVGRAWIVYKTTTIAVNTAVRLMNMNFGLVGKTMLSLIPGTRAYRLQQVQLTRALQTQTIAQQRLNKARMAGNIAKMAGPLGLVAGLAVEVGFAFSSMNDKKKKAIDYSIQYTDYLKKQNDETEKEEEAVASASSEFVGLIEQLRATNKNTKERSDLIKKINDQYGTTLTNISDEVKFQETLNKAVAEYIAFKRTEYRIKAGEEKINKILTEQLKIEERLAKVGITDFTDLEAIEEQLNREINTSKNYNKNAQKIADDIVARQRKKTEETEYYLQVDRGNQDAFASMQKQQYDSEAQLLQGRIQNQSTFNITMLKEAKNLLDTYGKYNKDLNKLGLDQNALLKERSKYKFTNNLQRSTPGATKSDTTNQKEFNTEFKKLNEYIDQQNKLLFENKKLNLEAGIEEYERRIKKEFDLQIENIKKTGNFEAKELNRLTGLKADKEIELIKLERDFQIQSNKEQYEREKEARKQALIDEKQKLLKQKDLSESARKEIEANFKIREEELKQQELKRELDLNTEKVNIAKEAQNKMDDIEREKFKNMDDYAKKFKDQAKDYQDEVTKNFEENAKEELEKQKELNEAKREFIKITADYAIKQSERVIEQIDKEIAAAEKQADTLRELAKEGNINAQQSLAEQERIIAESNKRKEKELKRQQRIRLAQSIYETYSKNLESLQPGEKTSKALSDTIRDTTLLQAFINSLPGFEKGTEDTGKDGRGVDGKGGMLSVLHPNERVIPKSLNDQLKGLSNEELTRIATEYQNGKIVNSAKGNEALNFAVLVNELQDLKKVIKDKPETNVEVGQITQSAMEIVQRTKKGNTVVYNRFKVK